MLTNITYKKKVNYLLIGIVLTLLLVYLLAIKRTVFLHSSCRELEDKLKQVEYAPEKISALEKQLNQIESIISSSDTTQKDIQQSLLEKASHYCQEEGVILKEFPQSIHSQQQDYTVETNILVLEGGFIKLLNFVYMLEQKYNTGKVVSTEFKIIRDIRTKRYRLLATIYIQHIKKDDYES